MDRARCRVLIVEDHSGTRDYLGDLLGAEGFETRQTGDGREALAVAEGFRPDLILLDLEMPIMDGRALLAELGRSERLARVPTIIMSAYGDRWDSPISLRQVAALLPKPFDPDILLGTIGRALDRESLATTASR
jgi:DNA-binding response OmpR family regulator